MSDKTTHSNKSQKQPSGKNLPAKADRTGDDPEVTLHDKMTKSSHNRQSTEAQRHEQNQHAEQQLKQQEQEQNERDQFLKGNAQEHQQGNRQH